jgi:hypothetical protein
MGENPVEVGLTRALRRNVRREERGNDQDADDEQAGDRERPAQEPGPEHAAPASAGVRRCDPRADRLGPGCHLDAPATLIRGSSSE